MKINETKLRTAIHEKGYTLVQASGLIGRSHGYFNGVFKEKHINEKMVNVIQQILGIPASEYTDSECDEPWDDEPQGYDSIKTAMKDALKEALVENTDELNRLIFSAVYGAIKKALREER